MLDKSESRTLVGRQAICAYLRITKNIFYGLKDAGLPVRKLGKPWVANKDQLDEFVKEYCRVCEGEK